MAARKHIAWDSDPDVGKVPVMVLALRYDVWPSTVRRVLRARGLPTRERRYTRRVPLPRVRREPYRPARRESTEFALRRVAVLIADGATPLQAAKAAGAELGLSWHTVASAYYRDRKKRGESNARG